MDDRFVSYTSSGTIRNRYTVGTRRIALTVLSMATVAVSLTPAQQTTGRPVRPALPLLSPENNFRHPTRRTAE